MYFGACSRRRASSSGGASGPAGRPSARPSRSSASAPRSLCGTRRPPAALRFRRTTPLNACPTMPVEPATVQPPWPSRWRPGPPPPPAKSVSCHRPRRHPAGGRRQRYCCDRSHCRADSPPQPAGLLTLHWPWRSSRRPSARRRSPTWRGQNPPQTLLLGRRPSPPERREELRHTAERGSLIAGAGAPTSTTLRRPRPTPSHGGHPGRRNACRHLCSGAAAGPASPSAGAPAVLGVSTSILAVRATAAGAAKAIPVCRPPPPSHHHHTICASHIDDPGIREPRLPRGRPSARPPSRRRRPVGPDSTTPAPPRAGNVVPGLRAEDPSAHPSAQRLAW